MNDFVRGKQTASKKDDERLGFHADAHVGTITFVPSLWDFSEKPFPEASLIACLSELLLLLFLSISWQHSRSNQIRLRLDLSFSLTCRLPIDYF